MKKILLIALLLLGSTSVAQQHLYSRTTPNTWSLTMGGPDCACTPTSTDTVEISHNWANPSFYPLIHPANIAFGTFFPTVSANNPYKVIIRNGGVVYQTGIIPTGMILQVDEGGMWAFNGSVTFNSTAANSIATVYNEGSILINGSFINNLTLNSLGEFCTNGTFIQTLGGTINGLSDANLSGEYTHTNYGGVAKCLQMIVLPVELLYFRVDSKNDYDLFEWATATEINNDYFEIEVSNNAITWNSIETIPGSGNSSTIVYYNSCSKKNGYTYARLKQVDYDGTITYSNIITFNNPSKFSRIIHNGIIVTLDSPTKVRVFEITGKLIMEKIYPKGTHEIILRNKQGFYMISIVQTIYKLYIH